jgi:hypothetical protein
MSFITLAILALENVRITSGGGDSGGGGGDAAATDQGFYQRVLTVLVSPCGVLRPPSLVWSCG